MKRIPFVLAALAVLPVARSEGAPALSVALDLSRATVEVSPLHYGLMTEEINRSYEGGLYGELIQNRAFRDSPTEPVHWSSSGLSGAEGSIALDLCHPLTTALPVALRVDVSKASPSARFSVANDGFWGIPVKPASAYRVSFYARSAPDFRGSLRVAIVSSDGTRRYAEAPLSGLTGEWQQYSAVLQTGSAPTTAEAKFSIEADASGTFWLDQVSLFPPTWNNRPNGNRIDLMQLLADLQPKFLRFPGGNYLEGDTFLERFNWKATIHEQTERPGHMSPWTYRSTDGFGLLEFLEWCEDLKMQPVLAVFAGYSLRHEYVGKGKELDGYVQDALDEIEYVSGPVTSKWGGERARDGHPEPFPLHYIEVGNEDWFDRTGGYEVRFAAFYNAIKKAYPSIQVIATDKVKSVTPDVIDEHFYKSAQAIEAIVHRYDSYPRTGPKIFVGEWATREGSPTPNLNAALGDSAWMTGMERNSDLVIMQSYAPLLVNVNPGGMQWKTDLIGFNTLTSYGSPAYYAQKLFSLNRGDRIVPLTLSSEEHLFASATRSSSDGTLYAKFVNASGEPRQLVVSISGARSVASSGQLTVLCGDKPTDTNTIDQPTHIVPVSRRLDGTGTQFTLSLAPYSLTVLVLPTK